MKRFNKIIFRLSIFLVIILIGLPILIRLTPLEFARNSIQDSFEEMRFFGLPAAILLTLSGTIKSGDNRGSRIGKIAVTLIAAIFCVFILAVTALSGMCSLSNPEILFQHKNDKNTRIELRYFGCGATDSGSPVEKIYMIKNISPIFVWVTSADTANLDRNSWNRVDNKD